MVVLTRMASAARSIAAARPRASSAALTMAYAAQLGALAGVPRGVHGVFGEVEHGAVGDERRGGGERAVHGRGASMARCSGVPSRLALTRSVMRQPSGVRRHFHVFAETRATQNRSAVGSQRMLRA